jgi:hypothetical protein
LVFGVCSVVAAAAVPFDPHQEWEMPEPDSDVTQAFGRIMAEYLPGGGLSQ